MHIYATSRVTGSERVNLVLLINFNVNDFFFQLFFISSGLHVGLSIGNNSIVLNVADEKPKNKNVFYNKNQHKPTKN